VSPSLRVLIAGMLFASGGALIKACEFPSLQRVGMRAAIAAVTLFLLMPEARRWPNARILRIVPPYFGTTCLFIVGNSLTTSANTIFLQSTAPLWIILLGPLLLKEPPTRRDLLVLVCIAAGMTLCLVAPATVTHTAPNPTLGNWFSLGAGVSFALLLLAMRWLARSGGEDGMAAIAWGNVFTLPLAFALMPVFDQTPVLGSARDWIVITALGTVQVGLAYVVLMRAIGGVPAVRASLLLMIEPALNPVITWLAHGEEPHWLALLGGALIAGAVVLASVLGRRTAEVADAGGGPGTGRG
jgi:drug/metabolite transporter (DMT)-like permease